MACPPLWVGMLALAGFPCPRKAVGMPPKVNRVVSGFHDAAGGRGLYDHAIHQFIGWNGCHPPLAASEPGEVLVQFAVRDRDERKINLRFAPQIVPR